MKNQHFAHFTCGICPFAGGDRQRQDEPALREGARPLDGALQVRRGAQPQGAHPGEKEREREKGKL